MKRKIATLLSLVLLMMAVLTMTACGSKEDSNTKEEPAAEETVEEETSEEEQEEPAVEESAPEETEEETLTGTYKGQLDFTSMMTEQFSESLGVEINDPLYMDVNLDLNEDQTFHLYIDAEKFKADLISIVKNHVDDIIAVMLEQNGLTMDQLGDVAQKNGYEDEEAFKAALVEELEKELDESIDLDEYKDDIEISGTYTVDGNTINLANDDGRDTITINDDGTLTLIIPMDDGENKELIMTKQ